MNIFLYLSPFCFFYSIFCFLPLLLLPACLPAILIINRYVFCLFSFVIFTFEYFFSHFEQKQNHMEFELEKKIFIASNCRNKFDETGEYMSAWRLRLDIDVFVVRFVLFCFYFPFKLSISFSK